MERREKQFFGSLQRRRIKIKFVSSLFSGNAINKQKIMKNFGKMARSGSRHCKFKTQQVDRKLGCNDSREKFFVHASGSSQQFKTQFEVTERFESFLFMEKLCRFML